MELLHTLALLLALAGCGSVDVDTDREAFDRPQEGVEDAADSSEGAGQKEGDAPESDSDETATAEQPFDDERSEVVQHAHVPRLPE